jgi:pyruvate,orthophosphate dikinase
MILAKNKAARVKALARLLPMQEADFKGIFQAMDGLPVTIRLLDPPLHEFLPKEEKEIKELAKQMGVGEEEIKKKVEDLHEFNPMLGHRGCRLGVTFPEIYEMQVEAIISAAIKAQEEGTKVKPEIEIPLIGSKGELTVLKEMVYQVAGKVDPEEKVKFKVGTMVELPRACLTADEIAPEADFLSFGTNDLTQTTYGFSRDDAGKFIPDYVEKKILEDDPFQKIDQKGVGKLMKWCVQEARQANPKVEVGICGEHGGEPSSVEFCHRIGLDYVSCSPYRVPIARLAAAQAVLKEKK